MDNRGVEDVCIVVCDDLKALSDAVSATWPLPVIQTKNRTLPRRVSGYSESVLRGCQVTWNSLHSPRALAM